LHLLADLQHILTSFDNEQVNPTVVQPSCLLLEGRLDCIVVNMSQRWQFRRGSDDPATNRGFSGERTQLLRASPVGLLFYSNCTPDLPGHTPPARCSPKVSVSITSAPTAESLGEPSHSLWLGMYLLVATFVLRPTKIFSGEVLRLERFPLHHRRQSQGDQDCARVEGAAHR